MSGENSHDNDARHWVEELFPPTFGYQIEDILKDKNLKTRTSDELRDSKDSNSSETNKGPSVFEQIAKGVSPLDVSAIKNVYERVWLMSYMEAEERKKKETDDDNQKGDEGKARFKDADTSTTDIDENAPLDVQNSCIWSSQEINVLRAVFKTAKEQNSKLKAQLMEAEFKVKKLEKQCSLHAPVIGKQNTDLSDAVKANHRLQILCQNLKAQTDEGNRKIDVLKEELQRLQQERGEGLKELHQLRVALDKERIDRKKVEVELQHQNHESAREQRIQEDNLKMVHQEDIDFLKKKIKEAKKELEKERKDHERTKRGLSHLRQHFTSLSVSVDAPGIVAESELKDWTN